MPSDAFAGVEYSVFGCGNRDWSATYQAIPTLIDAELEKHGGKRIYKRGEGDARGDFDRDYRAWYGELFPSLAKALDLPSATAGGENDRTAHFGQLRQQAGDEPDHAFLQRRRHDGAHEPGIAAARLRAAVRALDTAYRDRASPGVSYSAGDHLGIVPRNGLEAIRRVLMRFKLDPSLYATISPRANADTHLPVNEPVPLLGILGQPDRTPGRRDARANRDPGRSTPRTRRNGRALRGARRR